MIFADFAFNSQPIFMKICQQSQHYLPVIWRLPRILITILVSTQLKNPRKSFPAAIVIPSISSEYSQEKSTCPNRVSLASRWLQFQRCPTNWWRHSSNPTLAPCPTATMASGWDWQMVLCLGASPGILLQMMLAPRATTELRALLAHISSKTWINIMIRYNSNTQ